MGININDIRRVAEGIECRDRKMVKDTNIPMTSKEMYKKLYDKDIISDLRIKEEDEEKIIFGVKRSKYRIKIPKQVTPEIAYLA